MRVAKPSTPIATQLSDAPAAMEDGVRVVDVAMGTSSTILAMGADSAGCAGIYRNRSVLLTRESGDLSEPSAYRLLLERISGLEESSGLRPTHVAVDLHPQFQSRRYAESLGVPVVEVQHHHAHAVSVMAEHGLDGPVIAMCCDGLGWGADGTAWGCEVLKSDLAGYVRVGSLEPIALVGNDAAAIETWRPAAALMHQAFGKSWVTEMRRMMESRGAETGRVSRHDLEIAARYLESGSRKVVSSSLGRVFDGVSFLLGLCGRNDTPARAAIALENAATCVGVEPYAYETTMRDGFIQMSAGPTIRGICRDVASGGDTELIASRFHETAARMLATAAAMAAERSGLSRVVLAGGCFANRRLRGRASDLLEGRRLRVYGARRLAFGDSSIAVGQALVAGRILAEARGAAQGGG